MKNLFRNHFSHLILACCYSLDPLVPFQMGGVNFDYLTRRVPESEKLQKGGGNMVQWQVLLKVQQEGG